MLYAHRTDGVRFYAPEFYPGDWHPGMREDSHTEVWEHEWHDLRLGDPVSGKRHIYLYPTVWGNGPRERAALLASLGD